MTMSLKIPNFCAHRQYLHLSYFHTGVIVHTTKRSMSPSRIDARRLQDSQNETEKKLLGLTKSVDIRQAETYGCIKSLQRNDAPQQFGRRQSTNGTDDTRHGLRFSRLNFSADQSDLDQPVIEWVDRDKAREREILAAQNNKFDLKNDRVEKLKEIQIGLVVEKGKKNRRNSADLDSSENRRQDRPSIFRKEFTTGRRASGSMQGIVDLNSYHDASVVIKKGSNCHRDPSRKRLSMTKTGLYVSRAFL